MNWLSSHAHWLGGATLALAACTAGGPADRWHKPDGRGPDIGESSDCHVQANRLAAARYPDQLVRNSPDGATYHQTNPDRFPAEIRLYESCLRAKGFVRTSDARKED